MTSNAYCLTGHDKTSTPPCWNDVYRGSGHCKKHYTPFERSTRKSTLPPNWARIAEQAIRRDKGICYLCGLAGADGGEHVIPYMEGGTDDLYNIKAVHDKVAPFCHLKKTSAEGNEFQRQMRTAKPRTYNGR